MWCPVAGRTASPVSEFRRFPGSSSHGTACPWEDSNLSFGPTNAWAGQRRAVIMRIPGPAADTGSLSERTIVVKVLSQPAPRSRALSSASCAGVGPSGEAIVQVEPNPRATEPCRRRLRGRSLSTLAVASPSGADTTACHLASEAVVRGQCVILKFSGQGGLQPPA